MNIVKKGCSFGEALEALKSRKAVRLPSWKEDVMILMYYPFDWDMIGYRIISNIEDNILQATLTQPQIDKILSPLYQVIPDEMSTKFLYVRSRFGKVPWKETMIELMSEEWIIMEL